MSGSLKMIRVIGRFSAKSFNRGRRFLSTAAVKLPSSTLLLPDLLVQGERSQAQWVEQALTSSDGLSSAFVGDLTMLYSSAPEQTNKVLETLVRSSPNGLDFLFALRAKLAIFSKDRNAPASQSQSHQLKLLDSFASAQLKTLTGRQLLATEQLSLCKNKATHLSLIRQAKAGETVQRASSDAEYDRKLGMGRRVHALVHKAAPSTLLGVLYSAITPGLPSAMRDIDRLTGQPLSDGHEANHRWTLTPDSVQSLSAGHSCSQQDADAAAPQALRDTCVFYSVSTPHPATKGLRLGTRIIYDIATETAAAAPQHIKTFTTLSPIPGFVSWLADALAGPSPRASLLSAYPAGAVAIHEAAAALVSTVEVSNDAVGKGLMSASSSGDHEASGRLLVHLLRQYPTQWYSNAAARSALKPVLIHLCRQYLLTSSTGAGSNGAPLDPVAHFHLGNGASMGRLLWGADEGPDGLKRSAGLMVNYVYSDNRGMDGLVEAIEVNAKAYAARPGDVLARQKPVVVA